MIGPKSHQSSACTIFGNALQADCMVVFTKCTMQSSAGKHTVFGVSLTIDWHLLQISRAMLFNWSAGNVHKPPVSRTMFYCEPRLLEYRSQHPCEQLQREKKKKKLDKRKFLAAGKFIVQKNYIISSHLQHFSSWLPTTRNRLDYRICNRFVAKI